MRQKVLYLYEQFIKKIEIAIPIDVSLQLERQRY
jgi:hypothetical protein